MACKMRSGSFTVGTANTLGRISRFREAIGGTVGAMASSVGVTTVMRPARQAEQRVSPLPPTIWPRYLTSPRTKLHAGAHNTWTTNRVPSIGQIGRVGVSS